MTDAPSDVTVSDDNPSNGDVAASDDVGSDEASSTNDRARESVEHLQAAARELIAAARAALDVAEDLVDDPEVATSLAGAVGSIGDVVRSLTGGWRPGAGPRANGGAAADGHGRDGPEPPDSGVERIPVV